MPAVLPFIFDVALILYFHSVLWALTSYLHSYLKTVVIFCHAFLELTLFICYPALLPCAAGLPSKNLLLSDYLKYLIYIIISIYLKNKAIKSFLSKNRASSRTAYICAICLEELTADFIAHSEITNEKLNEENIYELQGI